MLTVLPFICIVIYSQSSYNASSNGKNQVLRSFIKNTLLLWNQSEGRLLKPRRIVIYYSWKKQTLNSLFSIFLSKFSFFFFLWAFCVYLYVVFVVDFFFVKCFFFFVFYFAFYIRVVIVSLTNLVRFKFFVFERKKKKYSLACPLQLC